MGTYSQQLHGETLIVDLPGVRVSVQIGTRPKTAVVMSDAEVKFDQTLLKRFDRVKWAHDAPRVIASNTGNATAGPGGVAISGFRGNPRGRRPGRVVVRDTGAATAGPGGYAVSGIDYSDGTATDITAPRGPVTVKVPVGTRVVIKAASDFTDETGGRSPVEDER